jgi:hypothetical protein
MMKFFPISIIAASALLVLASGAVAQEADGPVGLQSQIPPLTSTQSIDGGTAPEISQQEDADELVTDNDEFYARGFMDFDWQTHTEYVQQVLKDVVIPDYIRRTGKQTPQHPSIDVAAAMITNPYFNDLIVQSRLPGDCKPSGCLVQIYSLVGEMWVKKFEVTTYAMLAKPGDKLGTVLLGIVGNSQLPSRTVLWTGAVFQNM